MQERASRPGVTAASSTLAKTAISTSLLPAFSYSNSPTLHYCQLLARTWRKATEYASLLMASMIVVPQIVVALLSPWVGYHSEKWGRKPLLLLGFGLEIIRALMFAFSENVSVLLTAQLLGGISAATSPYSQS
jgi:MFS family permease